MNSKKILILSVLLVVGLLQFSCVGTFYVVRHAEKLNSTDDTPLSAAGLLRAQTLADSLIGKGIDTIFASTKLRTQQTARPLANRLNKTITIYGLDTIDNFTRRIQKIKKSVLVVSHSNLIPGIVQTLSGQNVPPILETDFDNLYIIKIKKSWTGQVTRNLVIARYGVATP